MCRRKSAKKVYRKLARKYYQLNAGLMVALEKQGTLKTITDVAGSLPASRPTGAARTAHPVASRTVRSHREFRPCNSFTGTAGTSKGADQPITKLAVDLLTDQRNLSRTDFLKSY